MLRFESPYYIVTKVKRKSRARYAEGIKKEDIVKFSICGLGTLNHRGVNFATDVVVFHNGDYKATMSQGELSGNFMGIFEIQER